MTKNGDDIHYTLKIQRCQNHMEALLEEQKKIQVFQRELPLCLELVNQAIDSCGKELSGYSTLEHIQSQSECSERTTSECPDKDTCTVVYEEFMPIRWSSSPSDEHDSCEPIKNDGSENNCDNKKSEWLRSAQLWNQPPDHQSKEDQTKVMVVEVKGDGDAFQKEKLVVAVSMADSQPLKSITQKPTTSSSTAETGGNKKETEQQKQLQMHRKQRRCWSPELHRRFLHALQQLGGSHVATPKQIRDLMQVDGLTNDEVKSHLQKYRLHTRRPATPTMTNGRKSPTQPQFMVAEGIWVPSHDALNNRVYAPSAVQPPPLSWPSEQTSIRRCKPPTSSSTHKHTLFLCHN